jgi:hypothetical protein
MRIVRSRCGYSGAAPTVPPYARYAPARRYRAFFDAGLPVCFAGIEYASKAEADPEIDAAIKAQEGDRSLY